jgi:regulator of replication initiation timing
LYFSNILEERHPSIENLDTYLKGNDSTLLGKKNIENQSYLGPSSFAHNQAVENDGIDDFRMTISFLRQQLSHKQKENDELGVEKETIDRDKNMLLDYSQVLESRVHVANTRSRELQKSNQLLVTEVTSLRKENTQIRKRLLSIEEKKDTDLSPIHAKYQRILSDKDADIKALKFSAADNLENGAIVSMRLEKQFEQERETYLTEIHKLKSSMKDTRANTNGYKEKLISVLETSQSNRNEETRKLRKEIKRLQRKLHEKHDESSQKSAQIDTSTTMVHISNLKDQMTTNDEQRHQSLLKIVASAKNVGNSKETRNGENSHLYSTYPQARRVNHNPTSQLIKTVEEFYISESERGKVCTRLLNNISQSVNKQTLTNSDSSRKGDGIG